MSRKATITLGLLIILMLTIVSVNALPRILPTLGLGGDNNLYQLQDLPPFPGWKKGDNYLMVLHCQNGFYWSDVSKGESICTLPSGQISAGDTVKNCQGVIVLTHIPSNTVIYTGEFSVNNIQDNPNDPDDPVDSNPVTPVESPIIKITKPVEKSLYFRNMLIKSSQTTRLIGYIDIEAAVDNPSSIDINDVKFYIDDELKHTGDSEPYCWRWNEKVIGEFKIKVVVYNDANEEITSDEISVSILNLKLK